MLFVHLSSRAPNGIEFGIILRLTCVQTTVPCLSSLNSRCVQVAVLSRGCESTRIPKRLKENTQQKERGKTGKKWGKTLDFELKSGADERT